MSRAPERERGFSMIEVLVAVIVVAIGLLGVAKMQAVALSSTGVASLRSLAALEAASLAASMHADRAYWSSGVAAISPGVTIVGLTISDANLAGAPSCVMTGATPPACTPLQVAGYDVQQWAAAVNNVLPNPSSLILCTNSAATNVPVTCTIQISWSEHMVAVNAQGTDQAGMNLPTYTLYVEP